MLIVRLPGVYIKGVHPMGERSAMLHRNLREDEDKIPESPNKYTKYGQ